MGRGAPFRLAGTVAMVALLVVRADAVVIAAPASASSAETLLTRADDAWPNQPSRFRYILAQLHQPGERLSPVQQSHLRFLEARQLMDEGDYGKSEPVLRDIMDHSGDPSLSVRAMAALIRGEFLNRDYVRAYALSNRLMSELPGINDPQARQEGLNQVILMLDQAPVGQRDLALHYARQMRATLTSSKGQCYARGLEVQSLLYASKLTSASPAFREAINTCLASDASSREADALRLDQASAMIDEGHAHRAIGLLKSIAPEIRETRYIPYVASLPVTLAQAYLSLGDSVRARKFALASIAVTGPDSPLWTLQAAYEVLYKAEKKEGHAAAALAYYEKYVALDKAALDDAKARALAYQMVRQQVLSKKLALDALSKQNRILQLRQALASQAQKTSRLYIALLLVVIAFITLAMLWLRRSQLRFRRMARHDGLTGAFNREHFFDQAERTLRRLHKEKIGVCLAVLDMDYFKQINDTHGHAVGDEVLRRTAAIVRQELRASDVFGRLGGEEFGILMPACSREQGAEIAGRIRRALAATLMMLESQLTITVTASFGLACCTNFDSGCTLRQLLIRADAALYCAKDGGRNQVAVDTHVESPAPDRADDQVAIDA